MIAVCGLDCTQCEAFIATQKNDYELRVKVAKKWSSYYGADILPDHINCNGCLSDGVKTYYCENMCEIRKCANENILQTCAECKDYACSKLDEVFNYVPGAKYNLDSLKQKDK